MSFADASFVNFSPSAIAIFDIKNMIGGVLSIEEGPDYLLQRYLFDTDNFLLRNDNQLLGRRELSCLLLKFYSMAVDI